MLLSEIIMLLHSELQKGVREIERRRESGLFLSVESVSLELPFSASLREAEEGMPQEVKGRIKRLNMDVVPGEGDGRLVVRFAPVRQPPEEAEVAEREGEPEVEAEPQEAPESLAKRAGIQLEDARRLVDAHKLRQMGARSETAEVLVSLGLTPERLAKMSTKSVLRVIERAAERGRVPKEYTLNLGEIEAVVHRARAAKGER